MIRAIVNIALLHLRIIFQDRSTYIQAFVVPAVLMAILGLSVQQGEDLTLYLDVWDADNSPASQDFLAALNRAAEATGTVRLCNSSADSLPEGCELASDARFDEVAEKRLEDQQVAAALIIPAGFGEALAQGQPIALEYRSNDQLNTPTLVRQVVETAISQVNSVLSIAEAGVRGAEEQLGGYPSTAEQDAAFQTLRESARTALQSPSVSVEQVSSGETVAVGIGASQSVPGMASMFVLFSLLSISVVMIEERRQGTLQRLMTLPTRRAAIVIGKIAGAFAFGVLQFAVFVFFGTLLGLDWGNSYPAIAALILSYCLAGTALGFLLSTVVRTTSQAANMVTLFGLLLAPLGGAWWPLHIAPDFMQTLGRISPIAWVMEGFQEILYYSGGLVDVLPQVGVLLLFALAFTIPAILNFRYE